MIPKTGTTVLKTTLMRAERYRGLCRKSPTENRFFPA
jgi:hypothetical protein